MNRLLVRSKRNNKGSSLIIVIVVLALIAVLATATLSAAMLNYRMKIVSSQSKKAFYTAEEATDQIYAGLGMMVMKNLNSAYQSQLGQIVQNGAGGAYIVNDEECNKAIRVKFAKDTINQVIGVNLGEDPIVNYDYSSRGENVLRVLNSYIEDYDSSLTDNVLSFDSVGGCRVIVSTSKYKNLKNYAIALDDLSIRYKDENGYFANITIDTKIALPDILIRFSDTTALCSDYAIIGDKGVTILGDVKLKNSRMYAGIDSGLKVGISGNTSQAGSFSVVNASINTPSDVTLDYKASSSSSGSRLDLDSKSRLFCSNVVTVENCKNAVINIQGSAYVKDDLNVDGESNTAYISGEYYGYSYEGVSGGVGHSLSSALMLNGKLCKLNISGIKKLMIGGRSYVNAYMMPESVSLRGNQNAYLVPDIFIKKKTETNTYYMNPIVSTLQSSVEVQIPSTFFAKANGYLVEGSEYSTVTVGNLVYYYLNIKPDKLNNFLSYVMNTGNTATEVVYLRNQVQKDWAELQQSSMFTKGSGSTIYTNGAIVKYNGSVSSEIYNTQPSEFVSRAIDLKTRFSLLNTVLYEPAFETFLDATMPESININGSDLSLSGMTEAKVFDNFIDRSELATYDLSVNQYDSLTNIYKDNSDSFNIYCAKGNVNLSRMLYSHTNEDNSTVTGEKVITSGLVVVDGDVTIDQNFDGLVFASGVVTIKNGAVVTNSYGSIDAMLKKLSEADSAYKNRVSEIFKGSSNVEEEVEETGEESSKEILNLSIGGITYKHIISFDDYRKY